MNLVHTKKLFTTSLLLFSAAFFILACGNTNPNNDAGSEENADAASPMQGKHSPFREGNFKYADAAKFGDFVIIRTKNSQVDSGTLTKLVVKFDIEWTSPLSYTLRYNSILRNPQSISLPGVEGLVRNCWMTDVTDTSYTEISTSSLNKDTISTPIVKL